MTYLLIQIALLMLAAYLCGTICGCLSSWFYHYLVGDRGRGSAGVVAAGASAAQPVIEVSEYTAGADAASSRFERALSHGPSDGGAGVGQARPTTVSKPSVDHDEVVLDTPTFSPAEPVVETPAVEPKPNQDEENVDEGESFTSVSVAAAAGAVAAAAGGAARARTAREEETVSSAPEPDKGEPDGGSIESSVSGRSSETAGGVAPSIGAVGAAVGALAAATGADDDLTRIRGIDASIRSQLADAGVTRFEQVAGWSADDVERIDDLIGSPGRVCRENWIEQAQMLAGGIDTAYTREKDNGSHDLSGMSSSGEADNPEPEPASGSDSSETSQGSSEAESLSSSTTEGSGMAVMGLATATAAAAAAASLSVSSTPASSVEDQQRIAGESDVSASQERPAIETGEEEPRPVQLSDAIAWNAKRDRTDLAGLRSVRSQALRNEPATGEVDDLKRIRGVGVLIEKKLNSLGISSYQQVANWTGHDIDRISQQLEFRGRIERENWVEQARILASGGHTEFSRRIDRRDG